MAPVLPPHDEVHGGRSFGLDDDTAAVDPFLLPEGQKGTPELVTAEAGNISAARTHARRGPNENGGVAAEPTAEDAHGPETSACFRSELGHRFADGQDLRHSIRSGQTPPPLCGWTQAARSPRSSCALSPRSAGQRRAHRAPPPAGRRPRRPYRRR